MHLTRCDGTAQPLSQLVGLLGANEDPRAGLVESRL